MAQAFRSTRVVTPEGVRAVCVIAEGERIAAVHAWDDVPAGMVLRDFGDAVLIPGLVDTHVHINDPGRDWEGFETATRAAAAGGVTMIVDMPLNCVPETTTVTALEAKRAAARGRAWVDWAAWGGVVRGNAEELPALIEAGVAGFKCFLIDSGIEGFSWVDEAELRLALKKLRGSGWPLLAHAEVAEPVRAATERLRDADWRKYATYLASRPDAAEVEAIALLISLAEEFQTAVHIVHLASAEALPLLAEARGRGVPVTVETCAHYLWFAAEEIADGATEYKCAPPMRGAANREALWKGSMDGVIDFVATDHSPCAPEMKRRDEGRWDLAWGGIASLGLALPVVWTGLAQRGMGSAEGLARVAEWMSTGPARLAGIAVKGGIRIGANADLVVFDPDVEWTVTEDDLLFRHKISPYLGAALRGRVLETWLRGERVYWNGQVGSEAHGREWIRR
jgi:allantoinase